MSLARNLQARTNTIMAWSNTKQRRRRCFETPSSPFRASGNKYKTWVCTFPDKNEHPPLLPSLPLVLYSIDANLSCAAAASSAAADHLIAVAASAAAAAATRF